MNVNIWVTSDHHFGHSNIIKYVERPFDSVADMDEEMVRRWNEVVDVDDTVYHLGDFTLGSYRMFHRYFMQLNGNIRYIPGGHDAIWLKEYTKYTTIPAVVVEPPLLTKKIMGEYITFCHYPLLCWEKSHYGSIHLHGHTHGTIPILGRSGDLQLPPKERGGMTGKRYDVGVDGNNFYPYLLGDLLEVLTLEADRPEGGEG